ncbi:hypothetical protein ACQKWADRAFT_23208 [Trichoderma austrokoningii]
MAALVGMAPLVDLCTAGPVMMPWSTALFQCGSFSFAGEKAGWARWARWAPPRRARLVRCTATHTQHSTACGRTRMGSSVTAYMHTNFGAVVDLFVWEQGKLARRMEPPAASTFPWKLRASPDAASVAAICS